VSAGCPLSGTAGKAVALATIKGLLQEPALRRLSAGGRHHFCPDPSCEIVYFDNAGGLYRTSDVRVPVWEKEPFGARVICYCFGENEAEMREESRLTGRSTAVERVRAHIAVGRCACEIRNPRGVCCLSDLAEAVERCGRAAEKDGPREESPRRIMKNEETRECDEIRERVTKPDASHRRAGCG